MCKGEGEAHLLIDDADVVLGVISVQGVNGPPGAGLTVGLGMQSRVSVSRYVWVTYRILI